MAISDPLTGPIVSLVLIYCITRQEKHCLSLRPLFRGQGGGVQKARKMNGPEDKWWFVSSDFISGNDKVYLSTIGRKPKRPSIKKIQFSRKSSIQTIRSLEMFILALSLEILYVLLFVHQALQLRLV